MTNKKIALLVTVVLILMFTLSPVLADEQQIATYANTSFTPKQTNAGVSWVLGCPNGLYSLAPNDRGVTTLYLTTGDLTTGGKTITIAAETQLPAGYAFPQYAWQWACDAQAAYIALGPKVFTNGPIVRITAQNVVTILPPGGKVGEAGTYATISGLTTNAFGTVVAAMTVLGKGGNGQEWLVGWTGSSWTPILQTYPGEKVRFTVQSSILCSTGNYTYVVAGTTVARDQMSVWQVGINDGSFKQLLSPSGNIVTTPTLNQCTPEGDGIGYFQNEAYSFAFMRNGSGVPVTFFTGWSINGGILRNLAKYRFFSPNTVYIASSDGVLTKLQDGKATVVKQAFEEPVGQTAALELAEGKLVFGIFGNNGIVSYTVTEVQPPPAPVVSSLTSAFFGGTKQTISQVAPRQWVSLWGANLALKFEYCFVPATRWSATQIEVDGIPATLSVVAPNQVNFQLPPQLGLGQHTVVAKRLDWNSGSVPLKITLVANSPTLATTTEADGTIRVFAQRNGTAELVSPANPAAPGDTLTMYATGLGASALVEAKINGSTATVLYAGATGYDGLSQINVLVPNDTTTSLPDLTLFSGDIVLEFPRLTVPQQ